MSIIKNSYHKHFENYIETQTKNPLFMLGDAVTVLQDLPANSIDFCMTSPPYWNKRQYSNGGIGLEKN